MRSSQKVFKKLVWHSIVETLKKNLCHDVPNKINVQREAFIVIKRFYSVFECCQTEKRKERHTYLNTLYNF